MGCAWRCLAGPTRAFYWCTLALCVEGGREGASRTASCSERQEQVHYRAMPLLSLSLGDSLGPRSLTLSRSLEGVDTAPSGQLVSLMTGSRVCSKRWQASPLPALLTLSVTSGRVFHARCHWNLQLQLSALWQIPVSERHQMGPRQHDLFK